ncbi:MAG: phosphate ABC transporter permease PstA [Acidimicrobiales bacterium]
MTVWPVALRAEARREAFRLRWASRLGGDAGDVLLCAASAGAGTWVLFRLSGWDAPFGAFLVGCLSFLGLYRAVVRERRGPIVATDRVVSVLVCAGAVAAMVPIFSLLVFVVQRGLPAFHPGFFIHTMEKSGPLDPEISKGAKHAIYGTLQQVGLATLVSVPLAVLTAVYLNEVRGRLAGVVRFVIDAMSGLPSVIAGLFVYALLVVNLHHGLFSGFGLGFSGLAASLALTVLMVPTITRATEEVLRVVPGGLREAALALGAPEWRVVMRVVLPTARAGIITGAILGIARGVGETAPVLLTAFGNDRVNLNLLKSPQADLPIFVFRLIRDPFRADVNLAFTGAMVLVGLVLGLFLLARLAGSGLGRRHRTKGWR